MTTRLLLVSVLLLLSIAASVSASPAPGSLTALLDEADKSRSSDRVRFQGLMAAIDARRDEATDAEREHLQYLEAYAAGIGGDYQSAIKIARTLADTSSRPAMQLRAVAFMANLHALMRDFTEGLRQLERALLLQDDVQDVEVREHVWGVAAFIYNQTGQHALSKSYAERVLAATTSERARCFAGQSRQEAMVHLGQSPSHDQALEDLIALCASEGELVVANLTRAVMARKWASEGRRDAAIELLLKHLPEVRETGYPQLVCDFESLLAELRLSAGELDAAQRHAEAAIEHGTGIVFSRPLVAAYHTLFKVSEARGDMASALSHHMQYAAADKAYLNEVKTRELAYQIVRHETLQQTQQIALLNQQNQLLQLQQRVQAQSAQNSRLVMAMLVLLMAFIGLWAYRTKRVQMSLRRMAETDALTAVCNRHHFTRQSEAALAHSARTGEEVALVMFDLDHFKSINDRYGHGVGDWVLRKVVETCRPICRQVDVLGRIGGEEFAVLMCGYDLRAARRMADDCRVRLAGIDTGESGYVFRITASFGVTTSHMSGYDLTRLLSHADKALYRAKRGGRNRVCAYEGNVPTQPVLVHAGDEPAGVDEAPASAAAIDLAAARKRSTASP